jgi:cytochrome P450
MDDLISTLLQATVEGGRHLTEDELLGATQILTLAGFSTTADATCNIVIRLIEQPGLEQRLRDQPEKIPDALEEIMRLEPPVTARPRRATHDVEIGGRLIHENERVLCNYLAANVDSDEWDDPETFNIDRTRNRVVTFGVGPHRCIGSNMARLSLRLMTEELLKRVMDIKYDGGRRDVRVSFNPSAWRACDSLPVTFTPLKAGAVDVTVSGPGS